MQKLKSLPRIRNSLLFNSNRIFICYVSKRFSIPKLAKLKNNVPSFNPHPVYIHNFNEYNVWIDVNKAVKGPFRTTFCGGTINIYLCGSLFSLIFQQPIIYTWSYIQTIMPDSHGFPQQIIIAKLWPHENQFASAGVLTFTSVSYRQLCYTSFSLELRK